jgi:hypothetical protein
VSSRPAQLTSHPLPILNISDHVTRSRLAGGSVIGALLGTRDAVVNSFEFTDETLAVRTAQCELDV